VEQAEAFITWVRSLNSVDIIKSYRTQCESLKSELIEKALGQLQAGTDAELVVKELANKLANRLIHAPTTAIKKAAETGAVEELTLLKDVLGIEE